MKTKVIKQIGYQVTGTVNMNFWGGGEGEIEMYPIDIYHPEMSLDEVKEIIHQGVNDAEFGVESFNFAHLDIYELYEDNVTEHVEEFYLESTTEKPFRCGFFEEGVNAKLKRIS